MLLDDIYFNIEFVISFMHKIVHNVKNYYLKNKNQMFAFIRSVIFDMVDKNPVSSFIFISLFTCMQ